jgi:hypothetical protein
MEVGQLEAAEEQARRTLAISERMGSATSFGGISQLLMNCLAYQGRLDEARGWGQRGLAWTTSSGRSLVSSLCQSYLSVTEFLANNYPEAERHARRAVESATDKPTAAPLSPWPCSPVLGWRRDSWMRRWPWPRMPTPQSIRRCHWRMARPACAWPMPRLSRHLGIVRGKTSHLGCDADWLHRRAETLDDPTMRPGFLERIPEHRRIRELAAELGVAAKAA